MNNLKDQELSELAGLKWLPWIGNHYFDIEQKQRILVVGESHYDDDDTQASIEKVNKNTFTRDVISEVANDDYRYKMFSNFHRILFKNNSVDTFGPFWETVAFFNFIQRPMNTKKGRPTYADFHGGWKTFFEVIRTLQPKICIFIGTTAANSFANAIENTGFKSSGVKKEDKVGGAYPRTVIVTDDKNNETKIIFIRHTSRGSWPKWHNYLKNTIPSELTWLEKHVSEGNSDI
jgi:hypothetical protein